MLRPVAFALLFVSHSALALGQPPSTPDRATSTTRLIPITGVVTDAAGTPVRGTVSVRFTLYDAQDSGQWLWTETQQVNADERGRYTTYLGTITPLPQAAFSQETARWLGVDIDGRPLPRVMLVAVPYALRAADAETLGGTPLSSFVTRTPDGRLQTTAGDVSEPLVDGTGAPGQLAKFTGTTVVGSSIITESAANQIGVGTTDPTEGGALDSKVTIRNPDGKTALAIANQFGTPRFALNTNADGSWITYDRATGIYQPGIAQRGGRVGIATTDPTGGGVVDSKFTVRNLDNNTGIAVLNEANARRFALNTLASGAWTMYDGGGATWNAGLSQVNGRVGIGTTTPAARLEIVGGLLQVSGGNFGVDGGVIANPGGQVYVLNRSNTGQAAGFFESTGFGPNIGVWGHSERGGPAVRASHDSASGSSGLALELLVTTSTADLVVGKQNLTNVFRVNGAGQVFAAGYTTGGADFAEEVEPARPEDTSEPGDVLVIGADRDRTTSRTADAYATAVIGIHSTKPGIVASPYTADDPRRAGTVPVAMIGIVPCRVSAENGPIARGDLLVTSSIPGHAMKGTDRARMTGAIVGKAMESLASGTGIILVAVTLQ